MSRSQKKRPTNYRFRRPQAPSLQNWKQASKHQTKNTKKNVVTPCGWGRLIFAHTFDSHEALAQTLCAESPGQRDIAFYLRDPHIVLSQAPQRLFLDPSHTYRLWLDVYRSSGERPMGFTIRRLKARKDLKSINRILSQCHMMQVQEKFVWEQRNSRTLTYFVAEDIQSREIIGCVCGVDHKYAFNDPENGSSLWSLAVDPNSPLPRVGEFLTRILAEHYLARGRSFMDLSVLHTNNQAIQFYEKLGFKRVPVFALKHKNVINEPLYIAPELKVSLNPYAEIIVNEARRRGINVDIIDAEMGFFRLTHGGRSIVCRESLTELTSAIAMSCCDDKRVTSRLLSAAGIPVPAHTLAGSKKDNAAFLKKYKRVVVKPARGEQGQGVFVDITKSSDMETAIIQARSLCQDVLIEQFVEGQDLRLIIINHKFVAASIRKPPQVVGTGKHSIQSLVAKQNRRRLAATGGESKIFLDDEALRCLKAQGFDFNSVPAQGKQVSLRKTANLHMGGTIHDVTEEIPKKWIDVAEQASKVLDIPVVGFDFIVDELDESRYFVIEANERPGLANHEPQPTAERFIDLLFPQTKAEVHYPIGNKGVSNYNLSRSLN